MNVTQPLDQHLKILLAEDDRELRELLAFSLFRVGYTVTSCSNGLELLERLDYRQSEGQQRYDLVLTDLRMPALTGLEVLEALHDLPGLPFVICMTAFGDSATHDAAKALGATETIDKPFDLDQLIALINSYFPATRGATSQQRSLS
ncbi:MAG: response regulator [Desulfuromonadaceae bacterium]|nr:response regulator [Desulfuromonadaceae bacterium]